MSYGQTVGKICSSCGGAALFFPDKNFAKWMSIINQLRRDGSINFSVDETDYLVYNCIPLDSAVDKDLSASYRESKKSKEFYREHDLFGLNYTYGLIDKKSKSSRATVLSTEMIPPYPFTTETRIKYKCHHHDTYTLNTRLEEYEKNIGPVFFRRQSEEESYICPVCGGNQLFGVRAIEIEASRQIEKMQLARSTERVESFIKVVDKEDISVMLPKSNASSEEICRALNYLIVLEKSIRTATEHLYSLDMMLEKAQQRALRQAYTQANDFREQIEKKYNAKLLANEKAGDAAFQKYKSTETVYAARGLRRPVKPTEPAAFMRKVPVEPIPIKAGLFNRAKVLAQNEANMKEYQSQVQDYERAKENHQLRVQQYNDALAVYERDFAEYTRMCKEIDETLIKECQEERARLKLEKEEILRQKAQELSAIQDRQEIAPAVAFAAKEVEEAKDLLKSLFEGRAKLRQTGIVHPKYWDIVAITSMAEYFETGRVETLTGPSGAYNLYESELRANIIISKLDTIISSLEQIKQNQFKLYGMLNSINNNVTRMNGLLNEANDSLVNLSAQASKIVENTAVTAYYAEKTAQYSKMNAELTDALGFMVALG